MGGSNKLPPGCFGGILSFSPPIAGFPAVQAQTGGALCESWVVFYNKWFFAVKSNKDVCCLKKEKCWA